MPLRSKIDTCLRIFLPLKKWEFLFKHLKN
ncbi:hypothetical protein EMIT0P44_170082 [Pseudomonas sp. IT-P44]